jgi:YHS domain-containing protein
MMLVEVAHPSGALDAADQASIADRILRSLVPEGHAPEATMRRARAMAHVRFSACETWTTGDGPVGEGGPTFVVTLSVPEPWRAEMSGYAVGAITDALRAHDVAHAIDRDEQIGWCWVKVVGVADGSIGLDGTAVTAEDVVLLMTEEHRLAAAEGERPLDSLPDGVVLDPVCGMQVRLGPDAITLEHEGATVGFCADGCRRAFARLEGIER